jgi:TolB-like protein/tetratricopeptide (TPR) repeat protein
MTLAAGTRLGPYEIESAIGAGGMGEVYRARDTRLDRIVAIKVVSERLSEDPLALARLEREARAVAALSHPNILALHDFGRERGITYAVMELLDGEPLDRRLASEHLSWKAALEIAASIADGLASAHAKGVAHRDLKPANIFITRDGVVKILDFGLAKLDPFRSDVTAAGTVDAAATEPSALLGTVGYMSPEQVKGETVDHRADIFSLGCVLYEMLTGQKAFRGSSPAETLAAILRDPPDDVRDSGRKTPLRIDPVIRRCLEKNPDHRFQSARDLAFAFREILADGLGRSSTAARPILATRRSRLVGYGLLVTLAASGAWWWLGGRVPALSAPARVPRIQSLAVLPLANLSSDREQEYFADGMTEELTTRLAKLGTWRVMSRTSVMGYRGTQKKVPEIARELDVDAVIAGSVIRDGSRVKVTAQLIDGRSDRHLWADTFERELESVMAIQDDVARAIATEVDLKMTPEGSAGLSAPSRRVLPAAFDAYVRGRHAWDKRSESDLREAIRYFNQSLDADPTYAPAYAGLADSYGQLGYGSYIAPDDAFPRASKAAREALTFDPTLAEAHAALGYAMMYYDWKFADADAEFKRSLDLNPNYAIAHQWHAYLLAAMERPAAEAEGEIAAAKKLDPLSVPINTDLAYMLHYYNRNEEALRSVKLALEMNPTFPPAYFWLTRIYTAQGRYAEAEAALQNIGPLRTWTPAMAARGFLYAKAGRPQDAKAVLKEFDDLARQGQYASSYAIAVIYAGLGDRERAFSYLEAAFNERSNWLVWLRRDPRWDEIRSDPRFRNLVTRVGLSFQ